MEIKLCFGKNLLNSDQPHLSGLIVTTYHENNHYIPLTTNFNDMINYLSSFYSKAVIEWHRFIYEEGRSGTISIQNTIYWGNGGSNKITDLIQLQKTHLLETSFDMTLEICSIILMAKSNRWSFNIANILQNVIIVARVVLALQKLIAQPVQMKRLRTERTIQVKVAVDVEPLMLRMKILNVLKAYNTFKILLFWKVKILIMYTLGKQQGARLHQQKTWFSIPISTEDYEQLIQGSTSAYQKQARKPIEYEYFLINFNSNVDKIEIELCQGCLGEITANSDYIMRLILEKEIKIKCKKCYLIINGECTNINSNCNSCDSNQCISCSQGYTLHQNYYNKCPTICPQDCIFYGQKLGCLKCQIGYYLDTVNNELYANQEYQQMEISFKCIDNKEFFIDADHINCNKCKPKTMPHCIYQYQEFYHRFVIQNDITIRQIT